MKLLLQKSFILLLFVVALVYSSDPSCINRCYIHTTVGGFCDICYFKCQGSNEGSFSSCFYENQETFESTKLSESQCTNVCYPEIARQAEILKKAVEQKVLEPTSSKRQAFEKLQKQWIEKQKQEQDDVQHIIYGITAACGFFTILSIFCIIKFFQQSDKKRANKSQSQNQSQPKQDQARDTQCTSSTSYYPYKDEQMKQQVQI